MAISINLYLDNRFAKKIDRPEEQEFPIKVTITKDEATAYLPTGVKVLQTQWKDRRVTGRKDKARLNDYLDSLKSQVSHMIRIGLEEERYQFMTATEVKNDISKRLGRESNDKKRSALFLATYDEFAESRKSDRTKEIYRVTGRKIRQLLPSPERIRLDQIDLEWLEDLDELLILRGNNGSTRSIDFRNIRAVIRHALKHKLMQNNPFDDFDMPVEESPDRALTREQMQTLINANVYDWERKYLDFFLLSFYLIGINTGDLMNLKTIEAGRVNYIRRKTGVQMSVKVEKEALEIINRYRGKGFLVNVADTYHSTECWTSKVDNILKDIADRNGLPRISMYWARHTWATIAGGDLGEDIGKVADALGHKPTKKVTQRYIRRKDLGKVDDLNRKVIDYVFSSEDIEGSNA